MKTLKLLSLILAPLMLFGCKNNTPSQSESGEEFPSIVLSANSIKVAEDRTFQLTATVSDSLKNYLIFWNMRDENIATVQDGLVTGVSVGNTICTVKCGQYQAICAIEVTNYEPDAALSIKLSRTSYAIAKNDEYVLPLRVMYGEEEITDYELQNNILNPSIVSMENKTIKALELGDTSILLTVSYLDKQTQSLINVSVI